MSFFEVIILGIVEGITEFLPISSTGHLILTAKLLGFSQDNFTKSFEIAIQLGAILLIVFEVFYSRKKAARATGEISYQQAFFIGVFQSLAVIPGISRAGAVII